MAAVVLIGLLVTGLGTAAFYYALWKGLLQSFRVTWANASPATRRQILKTWALMAVFMIALATVLITSPFGPAHTVLFVFGGIGVLLFFWLNAYVFLLARRARKR